MGNCSLDFEQQKISLLNALVSMDTLSARTILTRPYDPCTPHQVVEQLVAPALEIIGEGWEKGEYSLSQVYVSGRICEELVDLILPPMHQSRRYQPKMAIAVLEDRHMLGSRVVYSALRASGFELAHYGSQTVDALAQRVEKDRIELLLVSTLMLSSALRVKRLRSLLEQSGRQVKIMVGGAPFRFDPALWQEVRADACGSSAAEAVDFAENLLKELQ